VRRIFTKICSIIWPRICGLTENRTLITGTSCTADDKPNDPQVEVTSSHVSIISSSQARPLSIMFSRQNGVFIIPPTRVIRRANCNNNALHTHGETVLYAAGFFHVSLKILSLLEWCPSVHPPTTRNFGGMSCSPRTRCEPRNYPV
jgi:hypothetical protein